MKSYLGVLVGYNFGLYAVITIKCVNSVQKTGSNIHALDLEAIQHLTSIHGRSCKSKGEFYQMTRRKRRSPMKKVSAQRT